MALGRLRIRRDAGGRVSKTIYAVSRGSYSDYRIVALFSTKAKAQGYIAAVKFDSYDDAEIEEFQLDPDTADLLQRGYSVWRVVMLRDGSTERVDRTDNSQYDVEDAPTFHIWERTKAVAYIGKGIPDALVASVWAKSEKAAVKIANEKRAQMIASGEWK